mmetsp:Transcript_26192/g.61432  ORF Transcript_26192/g.61432 Transcript_26192/m.61432 type:complete len:486 (+) Transcript_26192:478-1935(+)
MARPPPTRPQRRSPGPRREAAAASDSYTNDPRHSPPPNMRPRRIDTTPSPPAITAGRSAAALPHTRESCSFGRLHRPRPHAGTSIDRPPHTHKHDDHTRTTPSASFCPFSVPKELLSSLPVAPHFPGLALRDDAPSNAVRFRDHTRRPPPPVAIAAPRPGVPAVRVVSTPAVAAVVTLILILLRPPVVLAILIHPPVPVTTTATVATPPAVLRRAAEGLAQRVDPAALLLSAARRAARIPTVAVTSAAARVADTAAGRRARRVALPLVIALVALVVALRTVVTVVVASHKGRTLVGRAAGVAGVAGVAVRRAEIGAVDAGSGLPRAKARAARSKLRASSAAAARVRLRWQRRVALDVARELVGKGHEAAMQHVNVIKAAVGQDLGGGGSEAVVVFVEDDKAALAVAIVHEFRRRLVLHEKALREAARLEHVTLLELGRRTHVKDEVRPFILGHRLFLVHHDPRAEVGLRAVDGNVLHGVVCLVLL